MNQTFLSGIVLAIILFASCRNDHDDMMHHTDHGKEFLYLQSNQASGNRILVFEKNEDGTLLFNNSYSTEGNGTGANIGSDGTVCLSEDKKWLYAVNAGSNTLAVFKNEEGKLTFTDTISTFGIKPVSVTARNGKAYVVNAGGNGSLVGFRTDIIGGLSLIDNTVLELNPTPCSPAQISFDATGNYLVISEKLTNRLVSYYVDVLGNLTPVSNLTTNSPFPYGFAISSNNYIYTSEATNNALSVYKIDNGVLTSISGPHLNQQSGSCWVALLPNNQYTYVLNAGSGTISGYNISNPAQVSLLNSNGVTASSSHPIETAVSADSKYIYFLQSDLHSIGCFSVNADGSLTFIKDEPGLPIGTAGMVL